MRTDPDSAPRASFFPSLASICLLFVGSLVTTALSPVLLAQDAPAPVPSSEDAPTTEESETPESASEETTRPTAAEADRELEARLKAVFDQLPELNRVVVSVRSGVVRLAGTVVSSEDRELAHRLAQEMDGTVVVDDRIEEARSLALRMEPVMDKVMDRLQGLLAAVPLLGVAILLVLLFLWLARQAGNLFARLLPTSVNPFVRTLGHQVVRIAVLLVGVVLALDLLDATALVGAVLGTAGVVGLALGFAFRDTAENYIASVLLSLRQPFAPNDTVVIEGYEGKVVRLTSRATVLLTLDGNHVRIPNAVVFKSILVNYTIHPERRFDFAVGVGTELALAAVLKLGHETLLATDGVLAEPPPVVIVESLGDSSVVLRCYGWVNQNLASLPKVKSEAIRRVKEVYDEAAVSMPEPIYQVRQLPAPGSAEDAEATTPTPSPPEARPAKTGAAADGTTPVGPPEPARETAEAAADISPEDHIDRQAAEDRRSGHDLLDPQAPRE